MSGEISKVYTDADLDKISFHDVRVVGFAALPDIYQVRFDVDFLVEWLCPPQKPGVLSYRISPATLVFENAAHPEITLKTQQGSYYINEDHNLPQRTISGQGVLHENYLSILYDIEAGAPPVATTHGSMTLRMTPSGQNGTGYFVTRSMANDGFVFGSIDLTRSIQ